MLPSITVHAIHSACLLTSFLNSLAVGDGTTVLLRRQLDNNKTVILRISAVQLCHPVPFVRSSNSRCCSLFPSSERGMGGRVMMTPQCAHLSQALRASGTAVTRLAACPQRPACLPAAAAAL